MKQQLYTKSEKCQPVQTAQMTQTVVARTMATLMFSGAEPRIYGRSPIPEQEVQDGDWLGRPWRGDTSDLPPLAWKPLLAIYEAGIKPIDVWIFHELPPQQQPPSALDRLRDQLPKVGAKIDTTGIRQQARTLGASVSHRLAEIPKFDWNKAVHSLESMRAAAMPVIRSATDRTSKAVVEAAPVVWDLTKKTVKVVAVGAVAAAAVAVPIVIGSLVMAATAVAAVDPVLVIIVPAEDGGDPVWIEVARWFEEV